MSELISAGLVAAVVSGTIAILNNRRTLQDSLDSKSGWRKELFQGASKTILTTDDMYLILAALRYQPIKEWDNKLTVPEDFEDMTAYIHYKLDGILKKYNQLNQKCPRIKKTKEGVYILDEIDADIVRMFTKYLLKHHWEDLGNGYIGRLKFRILKEKEIIAEVYNYIENKEKDRLSYENSR